MSKGLAIVTIELSKSKRFDSLFSGFGPSSLSVPTTSKGNFIRVFSWCMGPQTTWRMSAPAKMSTLTVSPCSGNSGEKRINQTLEITGVWTMAQILLLWIKKSSQTSNFGFFLAGFWVPKYKYPESRGIHIGQCTQPTGDQENCVDRTITANVPKFW